MNKQNHPEPQNVSFGRWLESAIALAGFRGLRAFSAASGVAKSTLWNYTHDERKPNPETLSRIAKALGLPLKEVLRRAGALGEGVAFSRADSQAAPLPGAAVESLEQFMAALLSRPEFKDQIAALTAAADDAGGAGALPEQTLSLILGKLTELNQRVVDLENERLRGLTKRDRS